MLVILVGSTLDVAKNTRAHFEKRGYSIISKYTYRPSANTFSHLSAPELHTEEEVDKCDFVYAIHNGKTGFYKAQIMEAVRGKCNALITMSPDNLTFIREIIASFGEYVIPVFLYIDAQSLEDITRSYITNEAQVQQRLETGRMLRRLYAENTTLFKKTVIFSSGKELNYDALYSQYDLIIREAEETQKKLNDREYVDLPYKGNQDYVFVSYSHKDKDIVLPYLSALRLDGYRIWYDEGIYKGANWNVFLGERLEKCSNFLLFCSANAVASERVEDEVNGAKMCKLHPVPVRLDDARFPTGFEMFLGKYQSIFALEGDCVAQIKSALKPSTRILIAE